MAIFPLFLSLFLAHADSHSLQLDRIKLPSGFKISVYAKGPLATFATKVILTPA